MRLLVAETERQANRIVDTLRLDRSVWRPLGLLQPLMGEQFDQIVVVWPYTQSVVLRQAYENYVKVDLSIKLPPGEKVRVI